MPNEIGNRDTVSLKNRHIKFNIINIMDINYFYCLAKVDFI